MNFFFNNSISGDFSLKKSLNLWQKISKKLQQQIFFNYFFKKVPLRVTRRVTESCCILPPVCPSVCRLFDFQANPSSQPPSYIPVVYIDGYITDRVKLFKLWGQVWSWGRRRISTSSKNCQLQSGYLNSGYIPNGENTGGRKESSERTTNWEHKRQLMGTRGERIRNHKETLENTWELKIDNPKHRTILVWPVVPLAQVWTHYKIGKLNMWTFVLQCMLAIFLNSQQIWKEIVLELNFPSKTWFFWNLFEFSATKIIFKSISPTL